MTERTHVFPRKLEPLLLIVCWVIAGCTTPREALVRTGHSADIPGLNLAAHRGKVVYIDFWASWCSPCVQSFPWMNAMQKKYHDSGLVVIGVNVDRRRESAEAFLSKTPAAFEIVYDPSGELASELDLGGMPCSFLVDRRGILRENHVGFRDGDAQHLEQSIQSLLKEEADGTNRTHD
jgi:thiol-disulfide isomerase/thioredoxin